MQLYFRRRAVAISKTLPVRFPIIVGAAYANLYAGRGKDEIPSDKPEQFFGENLK